MSTSSVNMWKEVVLNPSSYDRLNKNSDKIIAISDPTNTRNILSVHEALRRDQQLVSVGVNSINNKIFLIHYAVDGCYNEYNELNQK